MAEVAGQQIICYWHLLQKSKAAASLLPQVEKRPLPESVLHLLVLLKDFLNGGMQDLARIASDGHVDADERKTYNEAIQSLQKVMAAGLCVEYAEEDIR